MRKILAACLLILLSFGTLKAQGEAYQFFNAKGKALSFKQVLEALEPADAVFFGELHNNSLGHWLQLQVLKGLHKQNPELVLGSEIFEREDQLNINEWFADQITESSFESEAKLWKNYSTDYRPILRYAKENNLSFIASNVPRKYASLVSKRGLQALDSLYDDAKKSFAKLPVRVDMNLPGYLAMKEMMHGAPGNSDYMIMAQALKDATMAESLFAPLANGKKVYHINGAYHSKDGEGILWYLKQEFPDLKVVNIHTVLQDKLDKLEAGNSQAGEIILVLPKDSHETY
ncbi:ChaN family lipoprotein [Algoriphagus halophytocola]|uniref:ChaN family lipoprotein n=1 Tax=Algoriphagus halophytocola TaxID=2991499 RepID=A0ABY6MG69_9BACT|nr:MULTISPECIES: ChaN family lipoprotein [unclassified Algoriphagus]UZD22808.1 ChaN family lipoprotein [Algoriphagus sp. TR-M5]WBL44073.1 ChaN family lipoprotein [Algoriphagus sp. TR-M9]